MYPKRNRTIYVLTTAAFVAVDAGSPAALSSASSNSSPLVVPTAIGSSVGTGSDFRPYDNSHNGAVTIPSAWSLLKVAVVEFVESLYPVVDNAECLAERRRRGLPLPDGNAGVSEFPSRGDSESRKERERRRFLATTNSDFPKQRETNEERIYSDSEASDSESDPLAGKGENHNGPASNSHEDSDSRATGGDRKTETPFCDYYAPLDADIPGTGDIIGGNLHAKTLEECLAACNSVEDGQTCASVEFSPGVALVERVKQRNEAGERSKGEKSDGNVTVNGDADSHTLSDADGNSASNADARMIESSSDDDADNTIDIDHILATHNPLLGSCILNTNTYPKVNMKYEDYHLYIRKASPGGPSVWTDMPRGTVRSTAFFILAWIVGVGGIVHVGKWVLDSLEIRRKKKEKNLKKDVDREDQRIQSEGSGSNRVKSIPLSTFHHLNTLRFLAIFHVVIYHYLDRNSIGGTAQWILRQWDYYWNYWYSNTHWYSNTRDSSSPSSFNASPEFTLSESETPITWLLVHLATRWALTNLRKLLEKLYGNFRRFRTHAGYNNAWISWKRLILILCK